METTRCCIFNQNDVVCTLTRDDGLECWMCSRLMVTLPPGTMGGDGYLLYTILHQPVPRGCGNDGVLRGCVCWILAKQFALVLLLRWHTVIMLWRKHNPNVCQCLTEIPLFSNLQCIAISNCIAFRDIEIIKNNLGRWHIWHYSVPYTQYWMQIVCIQDYEYRASHIANICCYNSAVQLIFICNRNKDIEV